MTDQRHKFDGIHAKRFNYHVWRELDTGNEKTVDVVCEICGVHGEKEIDTGDVFWPAT